MTFHVNPKGRDWGNIVNWDDLGKLYAGIAITWTVLLCAASTWLFINRNVSFLRMRNIPLAITAALFLHVYLVKILLAYMVNGHFPCDAEFWIMSIYLPFGIALFQANIAQLQSVSHQQKLMLSDDPPPVELQTWQHPPGIRGVVSRWHALTTLHKTYVLIGLGMLAQLIVTSALYGTSRTLQGHWPADMPHAKGQLQCRKGPKWIPSAIWQLWWSCLYGPYLLYQIRKIADVHYWRLQIIISVIAGFPGSPLWLAAVYSPAFKPVNRWWVPPMWLAPGIMAMQAATLFIPIYEAWTSRHNLRNTLSTLKAWDEKRSQKQNATTTSSQATLKSSWGSSYFPKNSSLKSASTSASTSATDNRSTRSKELHTMAALDTAIALNPIPLLHFAATKDFTAENIVFLIQVREWRAYWTSTTSTPSTAELFSAALSIYQSSISPATSDFPINISSAHFQKLAAVFEDAATARRPYRDDSIVDFFKARDRSSKRYSWGYDPSSFSAQARLRAFETHRRVHGVGAVGSDESLHPRGGSEDGLMEKVAEVAGGGRFSPHPSVRPPSRMQFGMETGGGVGRGFDERVFDDAEASIKYLVLTNTWQKFVKAHNSVSP